MSDFTQDRSGHWYTADGKPCHTQPDGKKTTLRHARKQILFPSVTSILSIIPKHTVDDWRVEQAVLATMQCMVQDGASTLTAQEMMAKVASRLEDATGAGRKFGSEMHSVIEYINRNRAVPPALSPLSNLHPEHAAKYYAWLLNSGIDVEQVEVPFAASYDRYGYGGCIDMVGRRRFEGFRNALMVVVDFKTQKVKNGKPKFYPEWAYQLAAYRHSFQDVTRHNIRCMSVVIDSETGQIWEQVWPNEAIDKAITTFFRAFMLWMSVRDFYPERVFRSEACTFDLDSIAAADESLRCCIDRGTVEPVTTWDVTRHNPMVNIPPPPSQPARADVWAGVDSVNYTAEARPSAFDGIELIISEPAYMPNNPVMPTSRFG